MDTDFPLAADVNAAAAAANNSAGKCTPLARHRHGAAEVSTPLFVTCCLLKGFVFTCHNDFILFISSFMVYTKVLGDKSVSGQIADRVDMFHAPRPSHDRTDRGFSVLVEIDLADVRDTIIGQCRGYWLVYILFICLYI